MELKKYSKSYFDVIKERFSCRSFTAEKLSTDQVRIILDAANLAPTAVNYQPQRIYVVENPNLLEKMNNATRFMFNVKTAFVICYNKEESWKRRSDGKDHGDIDCSIVATHMMLAATSLGLGSCYVCSFKEEILKDILDIPAEYVVSCILPVGYPKDVIPHAGRKDIEDIVIYK